MGNRTLVLRLSAIPLLKSLLAEDEGEAEDEKEVDSSSPIATLSFSFSFSFLTGALPDPDGDKISDDSRTKGPKGQ